MRSTSLSGSHSPVVSDRAVAAAVAVGASQDVVGLRRTTTEPAVSFGIETKTNRILRVLRYGENHSHPLDEFNDQFHADIHFQVAGE